MAFGDSLSPLLVLPVSPCEIPSRMGLHSEESDGEYAVKEARWRMVTAMGKVLRRYDFACCWLICCQDASSREVAQAACKKLAKGRCRLCSHELSDPYDAETCRQDFRVLLQDIIREVENAFPDGGRDSLLVDDTLCTEAMKEGIVLSAVQAGIRHFKTGLRGRDQKSFPRPAISPGMSEVLKRARNYVRIGNFSGAQSELEPYKGENTDPSYEFVSLCKHWQSRSYDRAFPHAPVGSELRRHLEACHNLRCDRRFDLAVLKDMMDWSDYAFAHGDYQETGRLLYKCLEYAAKLKFGEVTDSQPNAEGFFPVSACRVLQVSGQTLDALDPGGRGTVVLHVKDIMDMFSECSEGLGEGGGASCGGRSEAARIHERYMHYKLRKLRCMRNHEEHDDVAYTESGIRKFRKALHAFFADVFPEWKEQRSFLSEQGLLQEEME